ncbi:MAG: adenylate/guanylate cyclase domain-containing protein [Spirochaetes bacterium]|nr:adenylate/guanylate cyclase domain-containing protein [Spirochaetota bacterium]
MSIRLKIILIVLPLVVATLLLTGVSSYFAASNGISQVAREFLAFKSSQLRKHAESQWTLLVENGLTGRPEMVEATREAVASYAGSLATSATELTAAFASDGSVAMATGDLALASGEQEAVAALAAAKNTDYLTVDLGGVQRVGKGFWFEPFAWYVLVTEERATFYAGVNEILLRTLIILGVSIAAAVVLVLVFTGWLTRPLKRVVGTMEKIITTNDLGERVEVEYHDEIGRLAQTFNLMVDGLETAYGQVRSYAYQSSVSRQREKRLRNFFQMYVPKSVIDQHLSSPHGGPVAENRVIAMLTSDIRGFTTISERLRPEDLVTQLNRYFALMVEVIAKHGGVVCDYIGDAIKAFFGAPDKHEDDALQAALSAIEMIEALDEFNRVQREEAAKGGSNVEWRIGVGVNYGVATVGDIGCEKKMIYNAIGRVSDFASELEGSTKKYAQQAIISERVRREVRNDLACRHLDIHPTGDTGRPTNIYTVKRSVEGAEREAWELHNAAMGEYFPGRNFAKAASMFAKVQKLLPGDVASSMMQDRCRRYQTASPPPGWDGAEIGETA